MDQQHGLVRIGVTHQAPANGSPVPAPEVVAWAHTLAGCATASWREKHFDGRSLLRPCSDTKREPMAALIEADAAVLSTALLAWWSGMAAAESPGNSCSARVQPDHQLDPYGIWIAEVMLQQTQLAVALLTGRWMAAFPTVILPASGRGAAEAAGPWLLLPRARRLGEAAQRWGGLGPPGGGWHCPAMVVPPPAGSFPVRLMHCC